jgi:hypothetical protein
MHGMDAERERLQDSFSQFVGCFLPQADGGLSDTQVERLLELQVRCRIGPGIAQQASRILAPHLCAARRFAWAGHVSASFRCSACGERPRAIPFCAHVKKRAFCAQRMS